MATAKTTTLTFRIEPGLKEALRAAAAREHRSIANMAEVLIRDYCQQHGVAFERPNDFYETQEKGEKLKKIDGAKR